MKRVRRWFRGYSDKLLSLRDTPQAIAGGVAIGIFFSFTPLLGVKTLLSLLFAWLFRCNLIAAVVAVTLHDIALPFAPLLYRWEYDLGYWLLNHPHEWPQSIAHLHLVGHEWRSWTTFLTIGKPLLLGSVVCSAPAAIVAYLLTWFAIVRYRQRRAAEKPSKPPSVE